MAGWFWKGAPELLVAFSTTHMDTGVSTLPLDSNPTSLHNGSAQVSLDVSLALETPEDTRSQDSATPASISTSPRHAPVPRLEALYAHKSTRRDLLQHSSEELRTRPRLSRQLTANGDATDLPQSARTSSTLPSSPELAKRTLKHKKAPSTGPSQTAELSPRVPTQIDFHKEVEFDDHKRLLILSGSDLFVYKASHGRKKLELLVDVTMATVNRPSSRSLKLLLVLGDGAQHRLRFGDEGTLALFKGHMQIRVKTQVAASARVSVVLPPKHQTVIVVGTDALALLRTREDNQFCAECQKSAPEYAATNLGIVICETCALAHRELSSNSSRVLSIINEAWNPYLLELMMAISNEQSNAIWEHRLRLNEEELALEDLPNRPEADSPFEEKRAFIEAKYAKRAFLDPHYLGSLLNMDDERPHMAMNFAIRLSVARPDLLVALAKFIAHGISPDYVIDSQALVVISCVNGNYLALCYLLENGANPNMKDSLGGIPLDFSDKLDAKAEEITKRIAIVPTEIFAKLPTTQKATETQTRSALPAKLIQDTVISSSSIAIPESIKIAMPSSKNTSPRPEDAVEIDDDGAEEKLPVTKKRREFQRSTSSGGSLGREGLSAIRKSAASTDRVAEQQREDETTRIRKASKDALGIVVNNSKEDLEASESPSNSDTTDDKLNLALTLEWPLASSLLIDYGAVPRSYAIPALTEEEEKKIADKESVNRGKAAKLLGLMDTMESLPPTSSPRSTHISSPRSPRSNISDSLEFIPTGGLVEQAVSSSSPRGPRKVPTRRLVALSSDCTRLQRTSDADLHGSNSQWLAATSSPESISPIASPSRTPSSSFSDISNLTNYSDSVSSPRSATGNSAPVMTIPNLTPAQPAPQLSSPSPAQQYAQSTWRTSSPSLKAEFLRSLAAPSSDNVLASKQSTEDVPAYEARPTHLWTSRKVRGESTPQVPPSHGVQLANIRRSQLVLSESIPPPDSS